MWTQLRVLLFTGRFSATHNLSEAGALKYWSMHSDALPPLVSEIDRQDQNWNITMEKLCALDQRGPSGITASLQSLIDCTESLDSILYEIRLFTTRCWCTDCRYLFTVMQSKYNQWRSFLLPSMLQGLVSDSGS